MYFPYLHARGVEKQVIKNTIAKFKDNKIIPIIDPYDRDEEETYINNNLITICESLLDSDKKFIIVVDEYNDLERLIKELVNKSNGNQEKFEHLCIYGFLTSEISLLEPTKGRATALLHDKMIEENLIPDFENDDIQYHIFMPSTLASRTYNFSFPQHKRVFLEDPFAAQSQNSAYPTHSMFSDLYLYYKMLNICGFGDFLTLGKNFEPSSGANMKHITAALHLTYKEHNMLYVRHYTCKPSKKPHISDRILDVMEQAIKEKNRYILDDNTFDDAIQEIEDKVKASNTTNLATLKRLSLSHHIFLINSIT